MATILETRGIEYAYADGTRALSNVSLTIEEGRKIALVGPNGAGKSTLMLMFNGILRPDAGEVLFRNERLDYDSRSLRKVRQRVGMVFQNSDDQLFAPTVYQDVAFGPVNLRFPPEKVKRYVGYALQYVGLSGYERRPPHHLSGGEKKRAAIAGILAMEPECIVLDEATAMLDPAGRREVIDTVLRLNREQGITVVLITHHMVEAERADRVIVMNDGEVAMDGMPRQVFSQVERLHELGLAAPDTVELLYRLRQDGVDVPLESLTVGECADTICRALGAAEGK